MLCCVWTDLLYIYISPYNKKYIFQTSTFIKSINCYNKLPPPCVSILKQIIKNIIFD